MENGRPCEWFSTENFFQINLRNGWKKVNL